MIWPLPWRCAWRLHFMDVVNFDGWPTTGIIVLRPPERRPILRLSPERSPFLPRALLLYESMPWIRQVANRNTYLPHPSLSHTRHLAYRAATGISPRSRTARTVDRAIPLAFGIA